MTRVNLPDEVLVAGVVRDCEKTIAHSISHLQNAIAANGKVRFLIIESDSGDGTVKELERLRSVIADFQYITCGQLADTIPRRTDRIAHCRNLYLKEIRSNPEYASVDSVVVADLDGVNDQLSREAYLSCWSNSEWDVCTANQSRFYYDIWALRHPLWNPDDCWDQCRFLKSLGMSSDAAKYVGVYSKMVTISPGSEWIEVESAFGGLGIYKKSALLQGTYQGTDANGREVCEHVSFHRELRNGGVRIFINPSLINTGRTEHVRGERYSLVRCRPKRKLIKALPRLVWQLLTP